MQQDYPILEFDNELKAVFETKRLFKTFDIPEHGIVCFYQEVIKKLFNSRMLHLIAGRGKEIDIHPIDAAASLSIYELSVNNRNVLVFHPGVGSPIAAAMFEEVIALGCNKFISCGSAGVLDRDIVAGHIIVPIAAIRDEGISYHYLPPSREVNASIKGLIAIENTLKAHRCEYMLTKTWTTDAIYRETANKVKLRKAEGCLVVEMEAASLFAVAQFRGVQIAQMLYGSDDVSGVDWDSRFWPERASIREKLFWLAVEACLEL